MPACHRNSELLNCCDDVCSHRAKFAHCVEDRSKEFPRTWTSPDWHDCCRQWLRNSVRHCRFVTVVILAVACSGAPSHGQVTEADEPAHGPSAVLLSTRHLSSAIKNQSTSRDGPANYSAKENKPHGWNDTFGIATYMLQREKVSNLALHSHTICGRTMAHMI